LRVIPRRLALALLFATFLAGTLEARSRSPRAAAIRYRTYTATAYCRDGRTSSGARTRTGIVAADPRVLPLGSVVRVVTSSIRRPSLYTVTDTGGGLKGRKIDIFMPSCRAANRFGKQRVRVAVVRRGWNREATTANR